MILRYLSGRDRLMVAACVVLIAFQVYLDLRIPEYMSGITDHLQAGTATEVVVRDGERMLLCAFASVAAALGTVVLAARVSSSLCNRLRSMLFESVGSFSRQDMDGFSAASLITRSTNDVYQIQQFLPRAISIVVKAPLIAVLAVWKISGSAFEWTAATVVCMLVMLAAFSVMLWRGMPYIRRTQRYVDSVNRITRDGLEGTRGIRAYNAEPRQETRLAEASGRLLDNSLSQVRIMSPMHAMASSMMNFLILAIYWIGAGLIQSAGGQAEQMSLFSDMVVFTSYATQVISAVMMSTGILRGLPRVMVSSRRIEEVVTHEPSVTDGPGAPDTGIRGEVRFEDVSFTYPGTDREVLSHVTFSAFSGETVAVIGPTASGKSSLVNLVPRLYDVTSGRVTVDGVDVREYRLEDLYSRIGYVPQTPVVFKGTVRENVAYGAAAEATDREVERALGIAQLLDHVRSMPEGIDTDLSQHGWSLSGGQRQRLAIARAVCRGPGIYIFDDTFSALDYRTDRDLRAALDRETRGATRIVVAQRVGTIMDADRIVVLDRGRVVGQGTHAELMRSCPLYREIAESQLEAA